MKTNGTSLKSKIASGIIWKLLERISAQIVSLVVSIILARILLPEDYGAVSLVTVFISLANVLVANGFGSALIQKKDADEVDFSSVFYFSLIFTFVLYALIFVAAPWIARFYNMPILSPVLRVFSLRIPIAGINSVQQAFVSRKMIFRKFFFSTLAGTVISAFVGIIMANMGFGVWALVAQYLTNTVIDTVVLWITVGWRPRPVFSVQRLKILLSFGWKIFVQSFIVELYSNMRSLVIGKVYTSADLAYYNKGNQFPNLISVNVDSALNSAIFPAMSTQQQDVKRVKNIARRTTKLCSYIMSPLLIGFAVCAESFVKVVLTEKWMPIVPYILIVCIVLLCRPAQTAILQAIKSVGRSDIVLKMDIPVRCLSVIALLIALKFGVIYIAVSEIIVEYTSLLIYIFATRAIIDYRLLEVIYDLGVNTLEALVMGVGVYFVGKCLPIADIWVLTIQILLGFILYILISFIMKNENFEYLLNEIKTFKNRGVVS